LPITRSHMGWLMNPVILLKTIKRCRFNVATNHSYILSDFPKTIFRFDAKFTIVKTVKTYEMKVIIQTSQQIYRIGRKPIWNEFKFSDAENPEKYPLVSRWKQNWRLKFDYHILKKFSFDCVMFKGNYVCFLPFFEVALFHL